MSTTAVRSAAEFEEQLQRYLFERSEEGRAVRVGEKEVSEQAAIVARYADLFSREQLQTLRERSRRATATTRSGSTGCARPARAASSPPSSRSATTSSRTRSSPRASRSGVRSCRSAR